MRSFYPCGQNSDIWESILQKLYSLTQISVWFNSKIWCTHVANCIYIYGAGQRNWPPRSVFMRNLPLLKLEVQFSRSHTKDIARQGYQLLIPIPSNTGNWWCRDTVIEFRYFFLNSFFKLHKSGLIFRCETLHLHFCKLFLVIMVMQHFHFLVNWSKVNRFQCILVFSQRMDRLVKRYFEVIETLNGNESWSHL